MAMNDKYAEKDPDRSEIDALEGPTIVEFGAPWCGFCIAGQKPLATAFAAYPKVRHIKIEDGRGRRLGRSFKVKLWPTLIFLNNGTEVARLVRSTDAKAIGEALQQIAGGP
ncbi:thioredoxin family protein [Noviherbaspirillum saxi]|uniref:Thioredoxin n=1 Tax=Noviherbaspirillum saxi TaxID=2320863 RepID=A0A3A3FIE6_9BURK|nr:thioredoxin family protein [Noviherbaspirillum saxi]RJF95037.1 thioredoxin [Noviherbaspirillum saxi]